MRDAPSSSDDVRRLRWLARLVTVLTVAMIAGIVTITALLVMRLTAPAALPLPEAIALPPGARAVAVTAADTWLGVVTDDGRLLIYDRDGARLLQEIEVEPPR